MINAAILIFHLFVIKVVKKYEQGIIFHNFFSIYNSILSKGYGYLFFSYYLRLINITMMSRYLISIICTLIAFAANAQFATSNISTVRTPQMTLNDDWLAPAVMELGSDDVMHFSFDEMSHAYHRYICKVTHCNAYGEPTDVLEIDYLDGFNDFPVDIWENSVNTTNLYTHYQFTIPNENVSLKLSGNYRVDVFDDEASDSLPVVTFEFAVAEPQVTINAKLSGDTDTSFNDGEQQLSFVVNYKGCNVVSPASDIIPVIYQNRRKDNAVMGVKPTYMRGNEAEYAHNAELIFEAGNEFRRFELTDPNSPGAGVEDVIYHDSAYHALLYIDKPSVSYNSYRDENGRFYINTLEGNGTPIEADYVNVHFAINMPHRSGGNYYLIGDFAGNKFSKDNLLLYDNEEGYYFTSQLLKLGVYNYQYAWVPSGAEEASLVSTEGGFHNTDNEYLIYIYHREFGARYDKLVGYLSLTGE